MSIDDNHIEDWSSTAADNKPLDSQKINRDLAAQFRNIKAAYRDESIRKQWERPETPYTVTLISSAEEHLEITIDEDATDEWQQGRAIYGIDSANNVARSGFIRIAKWNTAGHPNKTYVIVEWALVNSSNPISFYRFGFDRTCPPVMPSRVFTGEASFSTPQTNPYIVTIVDSKGATVTLDPAEYTVLVQGERMGNFLSPPPAGAVDPETYRTVQVQYIEKKATTFEVTMSFDTDADDDSGNYTDISFGWIIFNGAWY
jgi:hypothetical protein